jgi:predicted phage terminase large subunit-like protein
MFSLQQRIAIEVELRKRKLAQEAHEKYYHSLANFVRDAWHVVEPIEPYVHGWHIDAMCEHLQAVTDKKILRLLINVPPGMLKSLLVGVFWPCWEWGVRKLTHHRYLCAAHAQSLSIRDNIRARRLILSDWYQMRFSHVKLTTDQNAKIKFENTQTGFREAVAAGSITGSRGDRVLIDDPLSVDDANSEKTLESVKMWFLEAVPTRINNQDTSAIVVIMQRLHDEDISGIIVNKKLGYEHLMLPMEFEKDRCAQTSLGFKDPRINDGDLLFPERFNREKVDELKRILGEYGTASQLQQSPVPRGGGIIKSQWIQYVDELPQEFTYILLSYDTAFKDGDTNAFTVGTAWGVLNGNIFLIDLVRKRMQMPELLKNIRDFVAKHNPHGVLIEDKASGQSAIQVLKREIGYKLKAIPADRDKVTRAHAVTHLFEYGKIFFYRNAAESEFVKELTHFPYSSFSDAVDSTTMALAYIDKIKESNAEVYNFDIFSR